MTLSQAAEANLNSLIFNGTFEKFPRLKVLFVEYGFVWPIATMLHRRWLRGRRPGVPCSCAAHGIGGRHGAERVR